MSDLVGNQNVGFLITRLIYTQLAQPALDKTVVSMGNIIYISVGVNGSSDLVCDLINSTEMALSGDAESRKRWTYLSHRFPLTCNHLYPAYSF